jgi:RNA polymerase sigma-70 factor (ECF subfamily)
MERLVGGDLGALDELYDQYGAMAFSIAYRITGDRSAAEDVVQDAFLGAWRNAARYVDARGSVRTWLLSIVHHRAIDAIRRRRPTVELPGSEAILPDALTLPDAWADVELRLDRAAVLEALTQISGVQREAIELAYFGGLTQTEIAERTNVPLGTVKGRLRLGLQGLRAALQPPGSPAGGRNA